MKPRVKPRVKPRAMVKAVMGGALGCALLGAAGPAAAQVPRSPSNQPVVGTQPAQPRDTLVFKRDMQQLLTALTALTSREEKLALELRATPGGADSARMRLLTDLQRTARERFALMSEVERSCAVARGPAPDGYLGVNLNSDVVVSEGRARVTNTVVRSVEPGSPAERAGIVEGDRIIAIAGRDFTNDLPSLSDLLVPGRKLPVALEREGKPREFALLVAARPESFNTDCGRFERALRPFKVGARLPSMEVRRHIEGVRVPAIEGAAPEEVRIVAFAPDPAGMTSIGYFAGAEFRPLDDDWRAALGLKAGTTGVIVAEIAPGSPAATAGLKKGDVITMIGKSPATSPGVVIKLLMVSETDEARLTVLRARETRTITIRRGP